MRHTTIHRRAFAARLLAACLVAVTVPATAGADEADRRVTAQKLSFRYVDQPNNTSASYSPQVLDNAAIQKGEETGAFWTNANMARLQRLVRGLLRTDDNLQHYAAKILSLAPNPVIVYLIDDSGGPITSQAAAENFGVCLSSQNRAWPCAINMSLADDFRQECYRRIKQPVPARRDGAWSGQMSLGAFHVTTDAWASATFIHELVHTQDRTEDRGHLFWVGGRNYRYGADDAHYTVELVPNRAFTYKEGIANTISLLFDGAESLRYFNWFANNGNALVEHAMAPVGTGPGTVHQCFDVTAPSPDVWLYNQLQKAGVKSAGQVKQGGAVYEQYPIRTLPPKFIVSNEFILASIFSEYVRHLQLDNFFNAIRAANNTLYRASGSGTATLFDVLCRAGLPAGRSAQDLVNARASQAGPKPYLIPLAFADYFTAYRAATKAEYAEIFENLLPQAWIDLYWDGEKDNVRAAVPITATPRTGDLTSIAIALGVTSSR
jgi:hypothetical protein